MHIFNHFVTYCMQHSIIIRMLYHSFEKLLLLIFFFYLMTKSNKSFVKIWSCFQIALFFLFYRNFQPLRFFRPPPPPSPLIWSYLSQLVWVFRPFSREFCECEKVCKMIQIWRRIFFITWFDRSVSFPNCNRKWRMINKKCRWQEFKHYLILDLAI